MSALYSEGVAPVVFECDLDRDQAGIPSPYMLSVLGVLVAGKDMLIAAGDVSGAPAPVGWGPTGPAVPRRTASRSTGWPISKSFRAMANTSFAPSGSANFGRLSGPP
jgi:hypothetical protein